MMSRLNLEHIKITHDHTEIDVDFVHQFLTNSYWSKGISKSIVQKSIENSLVVALILEGQLVGFGRLITDYATFAYMADVFVIPEFRALGLSKLIVKNLLNKVESNSLRRVLLATSDAHGVYRPFGFKDLAQPNNFLEINQPHLYLKTTP